MSKAVSPVNPGASDLRSFYRANPARLAKLSEAAQATVREGSRGRLHREAIADYNRGRKPERQYVLGATRRAKTAREAQRNSLREAGVTVGKRGPLSKAALASLKG